MTDLKITDAKFEEEIKIIDKLVLVDFFATWCGPCKVLGPILEKVAEHFKDKIVLIKANVDEFPITSQKFGVEKIPTVVLFKSGKPINGFVGLLPEKTIKDWLENTIKEAK
ncbi:MAG: thioredoxin [Candidatus Staskawiczbacteria bacterium]|nr:thioredoxin [Candidatus Staskawiczbacteria bacterium]